MRSPLRLVLMAVLLPVALIIITHFIPVISVNSFGAAFAVFVVVGVLNALVRPLLIRLTLPITVMTFGLFSLIINTVILWLASLVVPGLHVSSFLDALIGSVILTLLVTAADHFLDDDDYLFSTLIRRLKRRYRDVEHSTTPGLFFLEIDGLAASILQRALDAGTMPTVARWMHDGSHRLTVWDPGMPSQTSACQAGILHGNNRNIPAFRWYEKESGHLMVSNKPKDAFVLCERASDGHGLLHEGGLSINNLAHGDAPVAALTMSRLVDRSEGVRKRSHVFDQYFADPNNFIRALEVTLWEFLVEVKEGASQRLRDVRPRVKRRGIYRLVRAMTTGALQDISFYLLVDGMFQGAPSAYVTFVGYDEVAHHAGPETGDAMRTLRRLDTVFSRLERASAGAPRPYKFMVLSDHGQSTGTPLRQKWGKSLQELVQSLIQEKGRVAPVASGTDGTGYTNALLTETVSSDDAMGKVGKKALSSRMQDGYVDVQATKAADDKDSTDSDVVVVVSGNLSLVYLTKHPGRASLEEIEESVPGVVDGLANHPGIGFVMARSQVLGPVAISRLGTHHLDSGEIEGEDPLTPYGPAVVEHLRRLDSFSDVGDLVIVSSYDPATGEVGSFEEMVGHHGGIGGPQCEPFILFPTEFELPEEKIVGAEQVYPVLMGWLEGLTAKQTTEQELAPVQPVT